MPAIITDKFRIANAETFVESFSGIGTTSYYYAFLAHPEPGNNTTSSGNIPLKNYKTVSTESEPIAPKDSFEQENSYHDSMLFAKRITSSDVTRVVPNRVWTNGESYDMYKNNVDIDNVSSVNGATNLYDSKFYVVTDEFKVYICINNGSKPDADGNMTVQASTNQPRHVDLSPRPAGDGKDDYLWKYLYTIKPADVIKFTTDDFIPVPSSWGDSNTIDVKNAAVDGKIETVLVKNTGSNYTFKDEINDIESSNTVIPNVPIYGDGEGATASVTIAGGVVVAVDVSNGGRGYTCARLELNSTSKNEVNLERGSANEAEFEVIIPPQGGHGADIYRELGAYRVLIHSKFDDTKEDLPDFVTSNNFSRVGVIKNPIKQGADGTSETLIDTNTASTLGALKLTGDNTTTNYPINSYIFQNISENEKAVGLVASYNKSTNILRYYQPVGLSTLSSSGNQLLDFSSKSGANLTIDGTSNDDNDQVQNPLNIDASFNLGNVGNVNVGVTFVNGIAKPEIKKYSGDIIYIDNRNKVTRSSTQKEEIKIVIEF